MAFGSPSDDEGLLGDINVTPLVDVMLQKGHQPVAAAHLTDYRNPPLVIVPAKFVWEDAE